MKVSVVLSGFLLTLPFMIRGQSDRELFGLRYQLSPLSFHKGKAMLQTVDLSLKFPVAVEGGNTIAGGMAWESLFATGYSPLANENVAGISTQWLVNRRLREETAFLFVASAGIYSDFRDLSAEDVRFAVGLRYKTRPADRLTLSYGIGLSSQFFGMLVAPFIDFHWQINGRLSVLGPVPLHTRLQYALNAKTEITMFLKPDNSTFRLSQETYQSRYIQKKQWNSGLAIGHMMTKHWLVTIRTGYTLRRKIEIYDSSQNGVLSILTFDIRGDKQPYFQHTTKAIFAEFSVGWVFDSKHSIR